MFPEFNDSIFLKSQSLTVCSHCRGRLDCGLIRVLNLLHTWQTNLTTSQPSNPLTAPLASYWRMYHRQVVLNGVWWLKPSHSIQSKFLRKHQTNKILVICQRFLFSCPKPLEQYSLFVKNCDSVLHYAVSLLGLLELLFFFFWHDQELLQLIHDNQVVVISGETGCGKTTQVPQFILDHHLENGTGSMCRVICTQPRRISAITVSFYVLHSFRTSAKKKISSLRRKFPQFWEIVLLYVLLSWNRVSRIRETSLLPQSKFSKPSKITI